MPKNLIGTVIVLIEKYCFINLEHQDKLNNMIQELSTVLAGVKHEQEYMEIRDNVHRASEFFPPL